MNIKNAMENGLPVDDALYQQIKDIARELSLDLAEIVE